MVKFKGKGKDLCDRYTVKYAHSTGLMHGVRLGAEDKFLVFTYHFRIKQNVRFTVSEAVPNKLIVHPSLHNQVS